MTKSHTLAFVHQLLNITACCVLLIYFVLLNYFIAFSLRNSQKITSCFYSRNCFIIPLSKIIIKYNRHVFLKVFTYFSCRCINFFLDIRKHSESFGCRSFINKFFDHINIIENSTFACFRNMTKQLMLYWIIF